MLSTLLQRLEEPNSTPEALKSFTRRTELMTSLPISSNTKTFHAAPSVEVFVGSVVGSSWASTSVTGALRFKMRFMLAGRGVSNTLAQ